MVDNPRIAIEIERRLKDFIAVIAASRRNPDDPTFAAERTEMERANAARLREIIRTYGWPGKRLVGERVAAMACMMAFYSDSDRAFQKFCLSQMEQYAPIDVAPIFVAIVTDRLCAAEGKPQVYGTQWDAKGSEKSTLKELMAHFPKEGRNDDENLSLMFAYLQPLIDFMVWYQEAYPSQ